MHIMAPIQLDKNVFDLSPPPPFFSRVMCMRKSKEHGIQFFYSNILIGILYFMRSVAAHGLVMND
jgi:hypothetical protein